MNEKVKGLAVILLPANVSQEEMKQIFASVLEKLADNSTILQGTREGYVGILDPSDWTTPNTKLVTLVENLLHEFGKPTPNPLEFTTSFICEYYGPRDLINHEVVTLFANVKEKSPDWDYLTRKDLIFLVYQCRNILSNRR